MAGPQSLIKQRVRITGLSELFFKPLWEYVKLEAGRRVGFHCRAETNITT